MELDRHGVWKIPNDSRPLIAHVRIAATGTQAIDEYQFKYSLGDGFVSNWDFVEVISTADGFELALPTDSSTLMPKYSAVVNWGGDVSLFLRPALQVGYTIGLLAAIFSAIFLNKRTIFLGVRTLYRELKPSRYEIAGGTVGLCVFFALNFRYASLPIVMTRHFDELSIIRALETFRPSGFVYGMSYNLSCLPFVSLGLIFHDFSWAIVGGRMQSAVSMLACALVFRRILALYLTGLPLHMLSILPFISPFFWTMGTLFRPDAQMTAFLLCSWLFFFKDRGTLGFASQIAFTLFGIAIALKLHALMYAPIIPAYVYFSSRPRGINRLIGLLVNPTLTVVVAYLVFEPRMMWSSYVQQTVNLFGVELWSHKSGFAINNIEEISIWDKLTTVSSLYSPVAFLGLLSISSGFLVVRELKSRNLRMLPFHLTNLTVIIYYGWMLNKDWAYYYISPYFLFVMVGIVQIFRVNLDRRTALVFASFVLLLQMSIPFASWRGVLADMYMASIPNAKSNEKTSRDLGRVFAQQRQDATFLLSYNVSLDYLSMGLKHSQISYVTTNTLQSIYDSDYGFLRDYDFDCIVLNKSRQMKNDEITDKFRNELPTLNYIQVFEDDSVNAFRRK